MTRAAATTVLSAGLTGGRVEVVEDRGEDVGAPEREGERELPGGGDWKASTAGRSRTSSTVD